MAGLPALSDILEEYRLVDAEDRYRLLIDLGRQLEPMPDALKTDATKVRGCSASVWVYPTVSGGRLHFLADSNAAITKGIVALVLSTVQDKPASEVAEMDVAECLGPFELRKHLSANRTQGVPNMIALVKQTAERYAAAAQ
jgi:cysteine desulfuration protein SufE